VMLGTLNALRGRISEARKLLDQALDLSLAARNAPFVTLCLAAYARLAFGEGDHERAVLLEGAADGVRQRLGLRAWPMLRPTETELMAQLRQALGADAFDQAFSAGSRLSQREAVAVVRNQRRTGTKDSVPERQPGAAPALPTRQVYGHLRPPNRNHSQPFVTRHREQPQWQGGIPGRRPASRRWRCSRPNTASAARYATPPADPAPRQSAAP